MARRLPRSPELGRRPASRDAKLLIIVVCEGDNTEPEYLRSFSFEWGNRLVFLKTVPGVGVPLTVVRRAVAERQELISSAEKSPDSFTQRFSVWAVFDVDEHPDIPAAQALARANKIQCAISNPCFELWALLHFKEQNGEIDRRAVQRVIEDLLPGYKRRGSKILPYDQLSENYERARDSARRICASRAQERNAGGNPSTNVYRLLELIIENGKLSFQQMGSE